MRRWAAVVLAISCEARRPEVAAEPEVIVAVVEPEPKIAVPARPPEVAPPPPVAAGPCPEGMTLVPGGTWTEAQRRYLAKWRRASKVLAEIEFADSVDDFCLDTTEVTVARFAACVRAGRCNDRSLTALREWVEGEEIDALLNRPLPIGHDDAGPMCRALGGRLPTIEEWLWAYWGGQEHRKYPWGNAAPDQTREHFCNRGCEESVAVGSFPAGAGRWGHLDLLGNLSEQVTVETPRSGFLPSGARAEFQVACGTGFAFPLRKLKLWRREANFPCVHPGALPVVHQSGVGWMFFETGSFGARCAADHSQGQIGRSTKDP